jgi:pentatricopeptide repeat protein
MKIIVQTLKEVGSSYGYNIKTDKGSYLMGKCNNYEEALKVADEIVAMGINPDIIKMHFSNYNNGLTNNQILA